MSSKSRKRAKMREKIARNGGAVSDKPFKSSRRQYLSIPKIQGDIEDMFRHTMGDLYIDPSCGRGLSERTKNKLDLA